MKQKKQIGGIFGGYFYLVSFLGIAIASLFVFLLTGKNIAKLKPHLNTFLITGCLFLSGIIIGIFAFFYKNDELLERGVFTLLIVGGLTFFSNILRLSFQEIEEKEEQDKAKQRDEKK